MKIAIIHPNFKIKGGAENIVLWLCEELSKNPNFKVTIFSTDFAEWEKKFRNISDVSVKKIPIPVVFQYSKLFTLIFATIYLKKRLKKFDVINPHNYPASLWVGLANVLNKGKLPKIIWSCNEPGRSLYKDICNCHIPENLQVGYFNYNRDLELKFIRQKKIFVKMISKPILRYIDKKVIGTFTGIVTLSNNIKNQVKTIYKINNVYTCYLGIKDINRTAEIDSQDQEKYFLTVCRLEPFKNIQKIIEAFYLLNKEDKLKNVKYFIIGQGPFENYLKNLIIKYNLAHQINLCGYINTEKLLWYYKNCLAFIYLPFDEPFGLPYLEAAAFSKPSIASNHGGPAELVIDGQTGLLVDPNNVNMIAEKIELMFNNKSGRNRMSSNAYNRYRSNFMWNQYVNRYLFAIKNMNWRCFDGKTA